MPKRLPNPGCDVVCFRAAEFRLEWTEAGRSYERLQEITPPGLWSNFWCLSGSRRNGNQIEAATAAERRIVVPPPRKQIFLNALAADGVVAHCAPGSDSPASSGHEEAKEQPHKGPQGRGGKMARGFLGGAARLFLGPVLDDRQFCLEIPIGTRPIVHRLGGISLAHAGIGGQGLDGGAAVVRRIYIVARREKPGDCEANFALSPRGSLGRTGSHGLNAFLNETARLRVASLHGLLKHLARALGGRFPGHGRTLAKDFERASENGASGDRSKDERHDQSDAPDEDAMHEAPMQRMRVATSEHPATAQGHQRAKGPHDGRTGAKILPRMRIGERREDRQTRPCAQSTEEEMDGHREHSSAEDGAPIQERKAVSFGAQVADGGTHGGGGISIHGREIGMGWR